MKKKNSKKLEVGKSELRIRKVPWHDDLWSYEHMHMHSIANYLVITRSSLGGTVNGDSDVFHGAVRNGTTYILYGRGRGRGGGGGGLHYWYIPYIPYIT